MSAVVVVAPIVIASWPAIAAAVTAVVGTMGFAVSRTSESAHNKQSTRNRAEIELADSEILAEASQQQQKIVVEKDGIAIQIARDARGTLQVCVEGEGLTQGQLREIGQEFIGRVTQQFVYHRLVTEMKQRNMTVIREEVDEDRTVRIRVRNF
jgi:hypothetical protein